MRKVFLGIFCGAFVIAGMGDAASAQTKRRKAPAKKPASAVVQQSETVPAAPEVPTRASAKRNERPGVVANAIAQPAQRNTEPAYSFEFHQPNFTISTFRIDHDASGRGTITFVHKDYEEGITDPITLSATTVAMLDGLFAELNFLDSAANYQYEKDYSHLGTVKITRRHGERSRTAVFNWTTNKQAKALADEYRKISNQYVWMFDIKLARENQQLETVKIMARLDGFLKRGAISDPPQLLPFLTELSNDERLPLMARNHAKRLIIQIEKQKK
ncbi:hypothetical protein BH24ACI3_BH24ACI3_00330 [soil metagenome]